MSTNHVRSIISKVDYGYVSLSKWHLLARRRRQPMLSQYWLGYENVHNFCDPFSICQLKTPTKYPFSILFTLVLTFSRILFVRVFFFIFRFVFPIVIAITPCPRFHASHAKDQLKRSSRTCFFPSSLSFSEWCSSFYGEVRREYLLKSEFKKV